MNQEGYQCLSCGEFFAEEPDEPFCPICFEDAIVSASYAERMSDSYIMENDYDDSYGN